MLAVVAIEGWMCIEEGIGWKLLQEVGIGWQKSSNDGIYETRLSLIDGRFPRVA